MQATTISLKAVAAGRQPGKRRRKPGAAAATGTRILPQGIGGVVHMAPSMLLNTITGKAIIGSEHKPEIIELLNMSDYTSQVATAVPVDVPLFAPRPSLLQFREFAPFSEVTGRLTLLNSDKVARRVRVVPPDSPYFSISGPTTVSGEALSDGRVAPGMEVAFTLTFKPQEYRDYSYDLTVVTEREKFLVPVRAQGPRAFLSFPDSLVFESTAVKSQATRTFVVRNLGDKPATYDLQVPPPFSVSPQQGTVPVKGNLQVTLAFSPSSSRAFEGELRVGYDDGSAAFVAVSGEGHDVDVALDSGLALLDATYISLRSETTVRLANRSEVPVHFDWRALAVPAQEAEERQRLLVQLAELAEAERTAVLDAAGPDVVAALAALEAGGGQAGMGHEEEEEGLLERRLATAAELSALDRKYRNLRRQVEGDGLSFTDGAFSIEPSSGTVWAQSYQEFTISFCPPTAAEYAITAFLDVTGRERRLPLELRGVGIGPKAVFAYDVLDVGDVYVTSSHRYELQLLNRGDIPADWAVASPATAFGSRFAFDPPRGHLPVQASATIAVHFTPDVLGEFSEVFEVALRGSLDVLRVHFKGHVIGPTFHADVASLDFGTVPYEFLNTRTLKLHNTSDVPFVFALRVPQDGSFTEREFDITPDRVEIAGGDCAEVQVDFVSLSVKTYDYHLAVDVLGVGEDLLSLPISATCVVPHVTTDVRTMDFGTAFLRYPYTRTLTLLNNGEQPARYSVLPQDEHHAFVGAYRGTPASGTVPAGGSTEVEVSFKAMQLGPISVPLHVRISGLNAPPLLVELGAVGSGPALETSAPGGLDWGRVPCLTPSTRPLELRNVSTIPAPFKLFVKGARSKFKVDVSEGVLLPGESTTVLVSAELDDTTPHRDQLHILVTEGEPVVVPLKAIGVGTTMHCDADISTVDFQDVWTNTEQSLQFLLENKGRRAQTLTWVNATLRDADLEAKRAARKGGAAAQGPPRASRGKAAAARKPTFSVTPSAATLQPRTAVLFTFHARSARPGALSEVLECSAKVNQERTAHTVFTVNAKGNFMQPLVTADPPELHFVYNFQPGTVAAGTAPRADTLQVAPLALTNVASLPLQMTLKAPPPFSASHRALELQPGETQEVQVEFDPGYQADRQSHTASTALSISYADHPSRDTVPLVGEMHFPNIQLDSDIIDFGTILNDTTKSTTITVHNPSQRDVALSWAFLDSPSGTASGIPINQVFDILPIRSFIPPGESAAVEFVFFGHAGQAFGATAVAEVEGGPTYEVSLSGAASTLGYRLDRAALDFGRVQFDATEEREFYIHNTGRVEYSFAVRTDLLSRPGIVAAAPMAGTVPPGGKQRIAVRLKPTIPGPASERLVVEVAHFPPVEMPLSGEGVYPALSLDLPRVTSVAWAEACDSALAALEERAAALASAKAALVDSGTSAMPAVQLGSGELQPVDTLPSLPSVTNLATAYAEATAMVASGAAVKAASATSLPALLDSLPTLSSLRTAPLTGGGRSDKASTLKGALTRLAMLLDVEAEAQRVQFTAFLEDALSADTDARALAATHELRPKSRSAAGGRRGDALAERFIAGRFKVDFGSVLVGATVKRTFRVTNTGGAPATFTLDRGAATAAGFIIEPSKVTRLGEMESVNISMTFKADAKRFGPPAHARGGWQPPSGAGSVDLGPLDVCVPVCVNNGPSVMLHLNAHVSYPEVHIAPSSGLDFGEVLLGQQRAVCLHLHNPSPMVADWSFGKAVGAPAIVKDASAFACSPPSGRLLPGHSTLVQVVFAPSAPRAFSSTLPLRVNNNPAPYTVSMRGKASAIDLEFSTALASLGPVLPCSAPISTTVTVRNPNTFPVEVFSLDFDSQYVGEEAIAGAVGAALFGTSHASGSRGLDLLRPASYEDGSAHSHLALPPRGAGEGLPPQMLATQALHAVRQAPAELADDAESKDGDDHAARTHAELVRGVLSWLQAFPDAQAPALAPRRHGTATDVVILVPPGFGGGRLAAGAAEALAAPCLSLTQCVEWARRGGGGEELRATVEEALVSVWREAAAAEAAAADVGKKASGKKGSGSSKKSGGKGSASTPEEESAVAPAHGDVPAGLAPPATLPHDLLVRIVRCRALAADAWQSLVISELTSPYAGGLLDAARAVAEGLSASSTAGPTTVFMDIAPAAVHDHLQEALATAEAALAAEAAMAGAEEGVRVELPPMSAARQRVAELQELLAPPTPSAPAAPAGGKKGGKGSASKASAADDSADVAPAVPAAIAAFFREHVRALATLSGSGEVQGALEAAAAAGITSLQPDLTEPGLEGPSEVSATDALGALQAAVATCPSLLRVSPDKDAALAALGAGLPTLAGAGQVPPLAHGDSVLSRSGKLVIPPPVTRTVVPVLPPQAAPRGSAEPVFDIEPQTGGAAEGDGASQASADSARASSTSPEAITAAVLAALRPAAAGRKVRWILPPGAEAAFDVRFASACPGRFDCLLSFGVAGAGLGPALRPFTISASGMASFPDISREPRNIFMSRTKHRLAVPEVGEGSTLAQRAAWAQAVAATKHKFVAASGEYVFGPLLAGCPPASREGAEVPHPHCEVLRFTNPTASPVALTLGLAGADGAGHSTTQRGAGGLTAASAVKPCVLPPPSDELVGEAQDAAWGEASVFRVEPTCLPAVPAGGTAEVRLWAFPQHQGTFSNAVVVTVQDNPAPLLLPVSCVGVQPALHVAGPWEGSAAPPNALDFGRLLLGQVQEEALVLTNTCAMPLAWGIPQALLAALPAQFAVQPTSGLLLPGASARVAVRFGSPDTAVLHALGDAGPFLAVVYCEASQGLPEDMAVAEEVPEALQSIVSGAQGAALSGAGLAAGGSKRGKAGSRGGSSAASRQGSPRAGKKGAELEGGQPFAAQATAVLLAGEAYAVQSAIKWPTGSEGALDFGTVRVGEREQREVTLTNRGKYAVQYDVHLPPGSSLEAVLDIQPRQVQLAPGASATLTGTFFSGRGEVAIRHNRDVQLTVTEAESGERVEHFTLDISGAAVFSKPRLAPSQRVNFGAVRYDASRSRTIELVNDGAFAFSFKWAVQGSEEHAALAEEAASAAAAAAEGGAGAAAASGSSSPRGGKRGAGKKGSSKGGSRKGSPRASSATAGKWGDGGDLPIPSTGRAADATPAFTLSPCAGRVPPGGTMKLKLTYAAVGAQVDEGDLRLFVSGAGPEGLSGLPFAAQGESCVPGVAGEDWAGIFEEQEVLGSLEDRVHASGSAASAISAAAAEAALARAAFGIAQRTLSFGCIVPTNFPSGKVERIRVSNPTKVPARIDLSVMTLASQLTGEGAGGPMQAAAAALGLTPQEASAHDDNVSAFELHPAALDIPAHEHRYVEVRFRPRSMAVYRAALRGVVQGSRGGVQSTLQFLLHGEGTFPVMTVIKPLSRAEDGASLVQFGRVAAGRSATQQLVLRNDGIVTATATFEGERTLDFRVPLHHSSVTLAPGEQRTVDLAFCPSIQGTAAAVAAHNARTGGGAASGEHSSSKSPRGKKGGGGTPRAAPATAVSAETGVVISAPLRMTVMHNPYDTDVIRLVGTAFTQTVAIVGVPDIPSEWQPPPHALCTDAEGAPLPALETADSARSESKKGGGKSPRGKSSPRGKGKKSPRAAATPDTGSSLVAATDSDAPHLVLGTMPLVQSGSSTLSATFSVVNRGQEAVRVQWPEHPCLELSPRIAHLPPGDSIEVQVSFQPGEHRRVLVEECVKASWQAIKLSSPGTAWSSSDMMHEFVAGDSAAAAAAAEALAAQAPGAPDASIVAVEEAEDGSVRISKRVPEPEYSHVDEPPAKPAPSKGKGKAAPSTVDTTAHQELPLRVSCIADAPSISLSDDEVAFKPTLMYASRSHEVRVTNASALPLPFNWSLQRQGPPPHPSIASLPAPFAVEPASGVLAPGQVLPCHVSFAPLEVDDYVYTATLQSPALSGGAPASAHVTFRPPAAGDAGGAPASGATPAPTLRLSGRAQRPIVHMDLPECDYLQRRPPSLPGPSGELGALDSTIKVLEFRSLGTQVRNTLRFDMINPTAQPYDFTWECLRVPAGEGVDTSVLSRGTACIHCASTSGAILPGHKTEVVFEYTPMETARAESFYRLSIPAHGLTQLVLVTGTVVEPKVTLDHSVLNFKQLLVGATSRERVVLENHEHLPFAFEFDLAGLGGALPRRGRQGGATAQPLKLHPASGVVPAKGRVEVEVEFSPSEEKEYNFNLPCRIKKKPQVLSLNVKGEGYAIHDVLLLEEDGDGAQARQLSVEAVTPATFGRVPVHEHAVKRLALANSGKVNFDFAWSITGSPSRVPRANALYVAKGRAPAPGALAAAALKAVRVHPEKGRVTRGSRINCQVEFSPDSELCLDGLVLRCVVAGTKVYNVALGGEGVRPALDFSWLEHDFGACFLPTSAGAAPVPTTATLTISNLERTEDVSVECLHDPHAGQVSVGFDAAVLAPGQRVQVPISFAPREAGQFADAIPFEVNGLHTVKVALRGAGVPLVLDLANPADKLVHLGALRVGQSTTRTVRVVNRSARPTTFALVHSATAERAADEYAHALAAAHGEREPARAAMARAELAAVEAQRRSLQALGDVGVSVSPRQISLGAREVGEVTIRFAPSTRNPPFEEALGVVLVGDDGSSAPSIRNLLSIAGSCQGMQVQLSTERLAFGGVCEGSRLTRRVQLLNTGDIGAHWRWDEAALGHDFSLAPAQGFVPAQSDVLVDVTFHPTRVGDNIARHGLRCDVEGAPPLHLDLVGECVPRPTEASQTVSFSTAVRTSEVRAVTLPRNDSDKPLTLTPVLDNDYWSGPVTVEVPPRGTAEYPLTYHPLTMTRQAEDGAASPGGAASDRPATAGTRLRRERPDSHEGSLFVAMPDGSGVLTRLSGKALPPVPAAPIVHSTPAKAPFAISIPVQNWLRSTQKFRVAWEGLPASAQLRGARSVEVPGLAMREHKLTFFAYTAGDFTATVTFTNELTQEYICQELQLKATAAGTIGNIPLQAVVRQAVQHTVTVDNPLAEVGTEISFTASCPHPAIRVQQVGSVTGNAHGVFQLEFRPLTMPEGAAEAAAGAGGGGAVSALPATSRAEEVELLLESPQLGVFKYTLHLRTLAVGSEPTLSFRANLGQRQVEPWRFAHWALVPDTYRVSVEPQQCGFLFPSTVEVPAATTAPGEGPGLAEVVPVPVSIPTTFEPSKPGSVTAVLTAVGQAGGTFQVELRGEALPPKPQGPFLLPPGGSVSIPFRNVFQEEQSFALRTDSELFSLSASEVHLAAKSDTAISIQAAADAPDNSSGKLIVQCSSGPSLPPWVFYLKVDAAAVPSSTGKGGSSGSKGGRRKK